MRYLTSECVSHHRVKWPSTARVAECLIRAQTQKVKDTRSSVLRGQMHDLWFLSFCCSSVLHTALSFPTELDPKGVILSRRPSTLPMRRFVSDR